MLGVRPVAGSVNPLCIGVSLVHTYPALKNRYHISDLAPPVLLLARA